MKLMFDKKEGLIFITLIILLFDSIILLDISFLRQIIVFLCLTLFPGLLILQVLKLNEIGSAEKVVLSVGLSVSFLMLFGLFINNLSLAFGFKTPLSTIPLLISFNIAFITLAIIGYKINKTPFLSLQNLNLTTSEKALLVVPILLPALSVFGIHVMNSTDNNIILVGLLSLISAYILLIALIHNRFSERICPFIILLISVSLLLMVSLRSNHIIGADEHNEFLLYMLISKAGYWSLLEPDNIINTCLSVTLLPVIFQSLLRANGEYIFKIFYSIFFSLSPVIIYIISKKYIGYIYAFLASIFFMSYPYFFWPELNSRTRVAVIFFALACMILFLDSLNEINKRILFIIFVISCIISHYGTTYIFFIVLLLTMTGMQLITYIAGVPELEVRFLKSSKNREALKDNILNPAPLKKNISITMILLLFVALFYWYSQLTGVTFNISVELLSTTAKNLNDFFLLESRGVTTSDILGTSVAYSGILAKTELVLSRLSIIFIAIGVLSTIWNCRRRIFYLKFLQSKVDLIFFVLPFVCSLVTATTIILPYFSTSYTSGRVYQQMFIILSMFFVIGGIKIAKSLKVKPCLIILIVLLPSFMCGSDLISQIFDKPRSMVLNSEGYAYDYLFIHDQECYSAMWLQEYGELKGMKVYTDVTGQYRLISQGGISPGSIDYYSLVDKNKKILNGYIYLRYFNIAGRKLADRAYKSHNISDYLDRFVLRGPIYSNGGSEIYI